MNKEEYKSQNEQRDKKKNARSFRERCFGWWKTPSDRFAALIALFTAVLSLVAYCQLDAMRSTDEATHTLAVAALKQAKAASDQAVTMQGQLDEIKRQSISVERSSTVGRAYIFARYITPQAPEVVPVEISPNSFENSFRITIQYSLHNYGQTPAVITGFEPHLFVRKRDMMIIGPDPESMEARDLQETQRMPAISKDGAISSEVGPINYIVQAGQDITFSQIFVFQRKFKPTSGKNSAHDSWFYCPITYTDIFGKTRHTWYYVGLYGAGAEPYPDQKYNRWD